MELPKGMEPYEGGARHAVGVRLSMFWRVAIWVAVLPMLAITIAFVVSDVTGAFDRPGANAPPGIVLWGIFLVLTALVAWVAVQAQRVQLVIDDVGVRTVSVFGNAEIRWEAMTSVALSQPVGKQLWFDAPGGIYRRGKLKRTKRIPILVARYATNRNELQQYILQRVRATRAEQ